MDDKEDLEVISNVFHHFQPDIHFSWKKVLELYYNKPELFKANSNTIRNEGEHMGTGQKLWKKSKENYTWREHVIIKKA